MIPMIKVVQFLTLVTIVAACTPASQTPQQTELISVYATVAAGPWLDELFVCANDTSVVLNISSKDPEIYLRIGEPERLVTQAYHIDQEEILIVTGTESPIQSLSLEEARALFTGKSDSTVQVWVYASGVDVQDVFDQLVMKDRPANSFARLAATPQQMSDVLNADSNAVGILPRRWMVDTLRDVYSAGMVPVLAITKTKPAGAIPGLIACLQG